MGGRSVVPSKFVEPSFTDRSHLDILTTTVYSLSSYSSSATPWLIAAVDGGADKPLHPLTFKPHRNLPENFNSRYFRTSSLTSFHHADDIPFDKIIVAFPKTDVLGDNTMVALYGGGQLIGRLPLTSEEQSTPWLNLSGERFDDVAIFVGRVYVVDRLGRLHVIYLNASHFSRALRLAKKVISRPITPDSGRVGWRKRLFVEERVLYTVVRVKESVFRVYKLVRGKPDHWDEVKGFDGGKVLFVSKDCCFFTTALGGTKYKNCIVLSEAGFPKYGKDEGWEFKSEDEIGVFRLSDGSYGRVGESVDFPNIDWLPPWVVKSFPSYSDSESERESDEEDGGVQSDTKESSSEDEDDQKGMELDSGSQVQEQEERSVADIENQEAEDVEMQSYGHVQEDLSLQEDVPCSVVASVSAVEEEVTKTLARINGRNEAITKDTPRKKSTLSAPKACTSSSPKRHKIDTATTKFEGFDIRSDLVPTLEKIWQKHGNIIENCSIRSGDIIGRALESLATIVHVLDNNSIESLSERQADYLSTTLSDLRFMSFNVEWLVSFVEKAVKLYKIKPLVDSLSKLTQLNSQVEERRAILLDEVAKLTEDRNKLKTEMAKVSKLIPFSGKVKLDVPLGSGLT